MALAAAAVAALAAPLAADAATSSDLLPGSRVILAGHADATATHGDTLYLGGQFGAIGYRAAGVAATAPDTGVLDRRTAEVVAADPASAANAQRVVADGSGGAYLLGLGTGLSALPAPPTVDGGGPAANWARIDASGAADRATGLRFTTGAGDDRRLGRLFDVAVAADGTTYLSGDFDAVDGEPRAGLAALREDGTLAPWAPEVSGGAVGRLAVVGGDVLLVGGVSYPYTADQSDRAPFTAVGGQRRVGLALVAGDTGAVRAWSPAGLTAQDASAGVVVAGDVVYLAASDAVRAVATSSSAAVRDLGLRPAGAVLAIAGAGGRLYVSGRFTAIGSQTTQPERRGLAEIDPGDGRATAWAPPNGTDGAALAVTDDRVYVGGFGRGCAQAFSRATGSATAWDPRLGDASSCFGVRSLAASGEAVWAAGDFYAQRAGAREGLAAIDVAADRILDWAPGAGGAQGQATEDLAVSPDGRTVYVAAALTAVNGVPRNGVAAVAATGGGRSADDVRAWDPAPDGPVHEVQPLGDGASVLLGGRFSTLDGEDRPYLAATAAATGRPAPWRPAPDGAVTAAEAAGDGTLYVGGEFTHVGAADRRFLAAFDGTSSDAPSAWNPGLAADAGGSVTDLALGDGVVYAAGDFDGEIGGAQRRGVAALRRSDGRATAWNAELDGSVSTVSTGADGTVYLAAGSSPFTTVQGARRGNGLAAVTAAGAATGWDPGTLPDGAEPLFRGVQEGYGASGEIRDVGGRVIVPGYLPYAGFAGLPQRGFLSFGTATTAPTLTTAPAVTGKRVVGERLTCRPGVYGGGSVSRAYVWLRDGTAIAGRTGSSYVVRDADVNRELACRETATNAVGPLSTTSAAVRIVGGAPTSEAAPEATGSPAVGQTLTCTEGLWLNLPQAYAYRWLRDGAAIAGATGASYVVGEADRGRGLACEVTASNDAGASTPARSTVRRVPATPSGGDPGGPAPGGPAPGGDATPPATSDPTPTPTTPRPTPKPTPTPTPTPPVPRVSVAAKATGGKGRRITLSVSPSGAGTLSVSASVGSGRKRRSVGSGRATVERAGAVRVTVRPSGAGRRALKAGRTVRVTFRVTFTAANGTKVTTTRTLKVRIRR